jgi:MFS transporter, PPP family, 3-phenylpropionic acid transporter
MGTQHQVLIRFALLYGALFSAFGSTSPFLPAFLAERGLETEEVGFVLGTATAVRLACGPLAGRLADRFQLFRAELAVCAIMAAGAALLYLIAQPIWALIAISLLQAAVLAPLVPLADALCLARARPRPNTAGFEYGWVRGVGSSAFVAGTLLAGYAAGAYGISVIMLLSGTLLLVIPLTAVLVPAFPERAGGAPARQKRLDRPWLTLLRQRAFVRVTLVGALVLGSHAMQDSSAVIQWTGAGISPATIGVLWSESVAAEVLVFWLIGATLLRVLAPSGALAWAALCGLLRWAVMAQTSEVAALAFGPAVARFHFRVAPPCIHARHYRHSTVGFGGNGPGILRSRRGWRRYGCFYDRFRMALRSFRTSRILGDGASVRCGPSCDLELGPRDSKP